MDFECVELEVADEIAIVRLNRPQCLNAIDQAMWTGLLQAFSYVKERSSLAACIVTGAGRGFCSGADLKETAWHGETGAASRARIDSHHQALARTLLGVPCPLIAAINGYALGGGAEIALACDIRLAGADAKIGFPEAAVGRSITGGASVLLTRAVGLSRAKRLLFTAEFVSAEEAHRIGLVDEVLAPSELLPAAVNLAELIAGQSRQSVRAMKQLVDNAALNDLEAALAAETDALVATYAGADIELARAAFASRNSSA